MQDIELRHQDLGFVLDYDYLDQHLRWLIWNHDIGHHYVSFILHDLFLDWVIADHGVAMFHNILPDYTWNTLFEWFADLEHILTTAQTWADLDIYAFDNTTHLGCKNFVLFKLRCEIASNMFRGV